MAQCKGTDLHPCQNLAQNDSEYCFGCGAFHDSEKAIDRRYAASLESSYRMIADHIHKRAHLARHDDPRDVHHTWTPPEPEPVPEPMPEEPLPTEMAIPYGDGDEPEMVTLPQETMPAPEPEPLPDLGTFTFTANLLKVFTAVAQAHTEAPDVTPESLDDLTVVLIVADLIASTPDQPVLHLTESGQKWAAHLDLLPHHVEA